MYVRVSQQSLTTPVMDVSQFENYVNTASRCIKPFPNCGLHDVCPTKDNFTLRKLQYANVKEGR